MAYNYFPQTYQYNPYQGFQQPAQQFQQPTQQYQQQATQPQIQNGGFVSVRNIEEAYNWPVAPGNSITFKDENSPYIYTKTKGFSQLEAPIFERFRLVKEEESSAAPAMPSDGKNKPDNSVELKEQINMLWDEVNAIKGQIEATKPKQKKTVKKEVEADEQISTDAE